MLRFELSKIMDTTERPVAAGATITAEGQALVNDAVAGGVKPATGAANEQFAGIAMAQQLTMLAFPKMEKLTAANGAVTLTETPLGSTLRITNAAGTALTAGDVSTNATYSISGKTVTVHASLNGTAIFASYRFAPTTLQAKVVQGDIPPGGAAALLIGQVGVITKGDVVTTEFDTTADWSAVAQNAPVKLAANGLFTTGGSGGTIPGAYIVKLPTTDAPFLGIHFSV